MPVFEVQTDAGTFQIDAPDLDAAIGAIGALPEGPKGTSLSGMGKSAVTGIARGAIGVAGLPADIANIASYGYDALTGNNTNASVAPFAEKYGSAGLQKKVEGVTGEFYKPQSGIEKTIQTVGEFAPAIVGGPGSLTSKALTRAVVPGVASEVAGQLTEGTKAEPAARIAAAMAGAGIGTALARSAPVSTAPARKELADSISSGYKSQAVKDLRIAPAYAEKVADTITKNLKRERFDPQAEAGSVYRIVDDLKTPQFDSNHTLADFDNVRRRLNEIAGQGSSAGEAAKKAIRSIDAATIRFPTSQVVAGDAKAASAALFNARKDAAAGFRSDKVSGALESAINTATATHSGGNLENEIYKQVRTMLNNPRKHLRGWTAEEKDALRSVLPGVGSSALRHAGKFLGGGGGLGQLVSGGAGAAMFGPIGMFALPAAGMAANRIGSSMAVSRLRSVEEMLRNRSPLGARNAAAAFGPPQPSVIRNMMRGGLKANHSYSQNNPQPVSQMALIAGLLAARQQQQSGH